MKQDFPKWIYQGEDARVIDEGPIPEGWGEEPGADVDSVENMNKEELEIHARQFGIELDRRKSRKNMLKDFERELDDGQ